MFKYRILVEWSDEDNCYVARAPAFPGLAAHGDTVEAATHEAREAAEGMLEAMAEDGEPAPAPDASPAFSGNIRLRLPKTLHRRLAYDADAEGVSLNQLMVQRLELGSAIASVDPSVRRRDNEPRAERGRSKKPK